VIVVLAALILRPEDVALAPERLQHRPRPGQRVVDGGDLITKQVLVLLVERDALVDNRLVVAMKRDAAGFVNAWALEVAGLDFERIEAAVVVGVEPFADRRAGPGGFLVLGKAAAIGVDAARLIVLEIDVSDVGRNHELERSHRRDHARHARRHAGDPNIRPLAAGGLVGQTRLEDRLVFGRERRLLGAAGRLGLVPLVTDALGLAPLAGPVGILRLVKGVRTGHRHQERAGQCQAGNRVAMKHVHPRQDGMVSI
jgi:hypothetical protein